MYDEITGKARTTRSEYRQQARDLTTNPSFDIAPGEKGSEPQPMSWADTVPFWLSMIAVGLLVMFCSWKGWL